MIEISNIDYTIGYDTTTGEKRFAWKEDREKEKMINWIWYMIYKELERIKNRFKIIITIDTTTGKISSRLDVDRDCNVLGVEWK